MKKVLLFMALILFSGLVSASIGIDYNAETNTYAMWNDNDIYFIKNGIQWSNHVMNTGVITLYAFM